MKRVNICCLFERRMPAVKTKKVVCFFSISYWFLIRPSIIQQRTQISSVFTVRRYKSAILFPSHAILSYIKLLIFLRIKEFFFNYILLHLPRRMDSFCNWKIKNLGQHCREFHPVQQKSSRGLLRRLTNKPLR